MKKRFFSFLCVVVLIVSMVQPFAIFAADDVLLLNGLTRENGNFVFDIAINSTNISYKMAYLTVAVYDNKGNLSDVSMTLVVPAVKSLSVDVADSSDINSYAIMLLDAENLSKPLCKPLKGNMVKEVKFLAWDIYSISGSEIVYYESSTSTAKNKLNVSAAVSCIYNGDMLGTFNVSDLMNMSEDTELKFIDRNGDSYFDEIVANEYNYARVVDIDVDNSRIKLDRLWIEFDFSDADIEYIFEDEKGISIELSDFETGDVVAVVANNYSYADATYLKIIKLTDNTIEGVVTEMATQGGKDYVWIDGVKYEDCYGLNQEDEGIFYISMTGKIFDFESTVPVNYAYVLEAAMDAAASFSADRWEVKLLTVDGVAEYTLTEDASDEFITPKYDASGNISYYGPTHSIADLIGVQGAKWVWDHVSGNGSAEENLNNSFRLITYKTNSKGEIKSLELVENDNPDALIKVVVLDEYNAKTQKLDGNLIEDDVAIFDITGNSADAAYATDITYLKDDCEYGGLVIKLDNEVKLLVITDAETKLSNDTGFAVVTDARYSTIDGEDVVIVDYIQDMNAGQVIFDDDSYFYKNASDGRDFEDLTVGDVIMFDTISKSYTSVPVVKIYAILGTISYGGLFNLNINALQQFDESNEFVYGYIASENGGRISKYEIVKVGGNLPIERVFVGDNTNTYSYFNERNSTIIKTNYITDDAGWYVNGETDEEDEATLFFARLIDGEAKDIYTFGTRITGLDNINAMTSSLMYVSGGMWNEPVYGTPTVDDDTEVDVGTGEILGSFDNTGYILEAALDSSASFSASKWILKLLTKNGVVTYNMTENASQKFEDYKLELGMAESDTKFLWNYFYNYDNIYRMISYTLNADGIITNFDATDNYADADVKRMHDIYNGDKQMIDGNLLEDDILVFDVTKNSADKSSVSDISTLFDNSEYRGFVCQLDGLSKILVVTDSNIKFSNETGFAIVTDAKSTTVDGEDFVIVDYIQDMVEGQITFNDDSSLVKNAGNGKDFEDLDVGDVIMFNADADGIVSTYAILATMSNGQPVLNVNALARFDESNEFIYGYIASEDGGVSTKYENVTVGFGAEHNYAEISVGQETNTYSYFGTKRGIEIKDQYITEDADWYLYGATDAKDEATFFFARLVDDEVIDIYTFNDRVVGRDNIENVEAYWVSCTGSAANVVTSTSILNMEIAMQVEDMINAIPDYVTFADEELIVAARMAYDALTYDQKAFVSVDAVNRLCDAEYELSCLYQ